MGETTQIALRDDVIRLGQLLKLAGDVEDGGHAREVIEAGEVTVNGEVETRRGRQIRSGDEVRWGDSRIRVTGPA